MGSFMNLVRDLLRRRIVGAAFLVAVPLSTDLFDCAKHLFGAATMAVCPTGDRRSRRLLIEADHDATKVE